MGYFPIGRPPHIVYLPLIILNLFTELWRNIPMAKSQKPRKNKAKQKSKIELFLRARANELREFLEEFNKQNSNMLSYDLILRVMLHRFRVLYLRETHPEDWNKYIGQYLREDVVPLTEGVKHRLLLTIYASVMTKNHLLKEYHKITAGPVEHIRGMLAICNNRDPKHLANLKNREFELEGDIAQAYTAMLDVTKIMTHYLSLVDDIRKFISEVDPNFSEYDKVLIEANQQYLKTLPAGDENKPAFRKDEQDIEEKMIEIIKPIREQLNQELAVLEKEANQTETVEQEEEAENGQKEE